MNERYVAVGYQLKLAPNAAEFVPAFEPKKGTVNPEIQLRQIEEKTAEFRLRASKMPYLTSLGQFCIVDLATHGIWQGEGCDEFADIFMHKPFLPHFESSNLGCFDAVAGPIRIVAFDPRTLLKSVGIECAKTASKQSGLPLALWYGSEHRDVESLFKPTECRELSTAACLSYLGLGSERMPGESAAGDAELVLQLIRRFDMGGVLPGYWPDLLALFKPATKKRLKASK